MLQLLLELTFDGIRVPAHTVAGHILNPLNSVILPAFPKQSGLPYSVIACAERAHAVRDRTGQPCVAPKILRPGPCLAPSK